ncbi:hypothetical protein JDO7802_03351 [Jannaschia donghaensis]|uniref:Uncharacterized protein n=2 Tax=Jannaschia donghaensis TaxID=420998 RepID=A0A0M6YLR9_9RHOB|nr:hypothetical protein JDO7802_03351 [Jannaschia donghaensis]
MGLADVPPVIIPVGGLTYTVSGSTEAFQNVYTINATVGVRVPDSGGTGTVGGAVGISSEWGPQGRNFDSDIVIDAGVSATFENNPIPLTNFQLDGDQVLVTVGLPGSTQTFGFTREELANGVAADNLADSALSRRWAWPWDAAVAPRITDIGATRSILDAWITRTRTKTAFHKTSDVVFFYTWQNVTILELP